MQGPRVARSLGNTRAPTRQLQNFQILTERNENRQGIRSLPGSHARRRNHYEHGIFHSQYARPPQASAGSDHEASVKRVYVHHNHAQRRQLDSLINHGCISTDLRTWEEVQTVWMPVPTKDGGGLGVGLQIGEVMRYVKKNARKHWHKGKASRELARRTWMEWVESHRKKVRPVVNNAEPRIRLGKEILWKNTGNGAVASNELSGATLATEALIAPQLTAPLMGELVLKFREINSEDIDPGLVDILYQDDAGRIIHPLDWREGFGIYGPDRPLPCHSSPHNYPMRAMPTERHTMSTTSSVSSQQEPPLYPHTVGIVTIQAILVRGYETSIRYHILACARAWGFGIDLTVSYPCLDQGEVTLVAKCAAPWERNILSGMETMEGLLTVTIHWA